VGTSPEDGDGIGFTYLFESCAPANQTDPENILENGDFGSCKISPWSLYYHDYLGVSANEMLIDGKWEIEIYTLADEPQSWHVQPTQVLTESQINRLEPGATYTISFSSSAGSDNRQCKVVLGQNENPYNTIFAQEIFLGIENESYSLDFNLNEKYTSMKFSFDIGTESSSVTLDNIRLVKKTGGNPNALIQNLSPDLNVFPNPASDIIEIDIKQPATTSIFNNQGILVKTQDINESNNKIDVASLEEGFFIVTIRSSHFAMTQKIIIKR